MNSYLVNSYEVCLYYTYECIIQYSLAKELSSLVCSGRLLRLTIDILYLIVHRNFNYYLVILLTEYHKVILKKFIIKQ